MKDLQCEILRALRAWVSRARALRLIALERWIELMKRRSELPFRAWFLHTVDRKIVRRSQEALTTAFRRRAARALLGRMLHGWCDLAVRKRVEVRTRGELLRALLEQEEANSLLEANVHEYSLVLREAEISLQQEDFKQKGLLVRQQHLEADLVTAQLAVHASQQESAKLRSALRNYEMRFPNAFRVPGEAREKLAQAPLLVSADEFLLLGRVRWASESHLYDVAYVPPPAAEAPADRELGRLQRFLEYMLRGTLPDGNALDRPGVTEAEVLRLIEHGKLEVPDGLEERPLHSRVPTQTDGGEALERGRRTGGFWSSNPFAGEETGLLRINERALNWGDIAQSVGTVLSTEGSAAERAAAAHAGQGREGVQRRIQEGKDWKHAHQPRKPDPSEANVSIYSMRGAGEEDPARRRLSRESGTVSARSEAESGVAWPEIHRAEQARPGGVSPTSAVVESRH